MSLHDDCCLHALYCTQHCLCVHILLSSAVQLRHTLTHQHDGVQVGDFITNVIPIKTPCCIGCMQHYIWVIDCMLYPGFWKYIVESWLLLPFKVLSGIIPCAANCMKQLYNMLQFAWKQ